MKREEAHTQDVYVDRKALKRKLAELAGLSETTVSLALNRHPRVNPNTCDRVARIAHELGYQPHRGARSLIRSRFKSGERSRLEHVGFMALMQKNKKFSMGYISLLLGVEEASRRDNCAVLFGTLDPTDPSELQRFANLRFENVDGWILAGLIDKAIVETALKWHVPFVVAANKFDNASCGWVDVDNAKAARMGVEILAQEGCRNVCLIGTENRFTYEKEVAQGFLEGLADTGMKNRSNNIFYLGHPEASLSPFDLADKLLRQKSPFDGWLLGEPGLEPVFADILATRPTQMRKRVRMIGLEVDQRLKLINTKRAIILPLKDTGAATYDLLKLDLSGEHSASSSCRHIRIMPFLSAPS